MNSEVIDQSGEVLSGCDLDTSRLATMPVDELVDLYQRELATELAARNVRVQLAAALAARSPQEGECRTTRLRGEQRRVKIEWPAHSWNQVILREALERFPAIATQYLKIESVGVRMVEFKKVLNEKGPEWFEEFKELILSARREPQGIPRILVEE